MLGGDGGEHEADRGAAEVVGADVGVQREAGQDASGRFAPEAALAEVTAARQADLGEPEEVERAEVEGGADRGEGTEEHAQHALARFVEPIGELVKGAGVLGQTAEVGEVAAPSYDGGAGAVGGGVRAVDLGVTPAEARALEIELEQRLGGEAEAEEGGAEIVDEAGAGERARAHGAAGLVVGLEHEDGPARSSEGDGCDEAVRPGADDDRVGIVHTMLPSIVQSMQLQQQPTNIGATHARNALPPPQSCTTS